MKKTTCRLASLTAAALFGLTTLGTGTAYAAVEYCSDEAPITSNEDGLSTSDVTFRGSAADDCYGIGAGNPDDSTYAGLWGGGWEDAIKSDNGNAGSGDFLGLTWTIQADTEKAGDWYLTISGDPGSFPVTVDLVAVIKGGPDWAAYLFTAETFDMADTYAGTFVVKITVGNDQNPALSHMDLLLREGTTTVPEPASMLLLGLGVALAASGRRFQRRSSASRTA